MRKDQVSSENEPNLPIKHVHKLGWPERAALIVLSMLTVWAFLHDKVDKLGNVLKAFGNLFS